MSAQKRNLRTLSGGEKSYSTTALILALWESMQPPFRVLDEFDVFMDMVNRTVALGQIISYAKETRKFQCKYTFVPREARDSRSRVTCQGEEGSW